MAYQEILFERSEGVATITLNRPEQLNAFTSRMLDELLHVFRGMGQDPEVRAIIITGAGRAFCGGEDFKSRAEAEVQAEPKPAPTNPNYYSDFSPKPVIIQPTSPQPQPVPVYDPLNPAPPPPFEGTSLRDPFEMPVYGSTPNVQPQTVVTPVSGEPLSVPKPQSVTDMLKTGYDPLIKQIREIPKPVIAAVNGVAAGTGLGLALACDFRYATDRARFLEVSARVGLMPGSGIGFFLPRLIGISKALELAFNGDELNAQEAERLGLVSKVFIGDRLVPEVRKIAVRYAKGPTKAIGLSKKLIYASTMLNLGESLELEGQLMEEAVGSLDYKEGLKAFLEKRSPDFKGK
jgi:2-(1,2-epoxy-1,2-dihydrophenyl)acetyl-CoA isomerase